MINILSATMILDSSFYWYLYWKVMDGKGSV